MMGDSLSANTQAVLLLTAPLMLGRNTTSVNLLSLSEYNRLAQLLRQHGLEPADLINPDRLSTLEVFGQVFDLERLQRLLDRGFLLSQAVESWSARSIWVVGRADGRYPQRLKERLKGYAPAVLYGCGDIRILDTGGLAVVGSRNVDDALVAYTERIGRLAAQAGQTVISGGARGIDKAAMHGAIQGNGWCVGVLGDSLNTAVLAAEYREGLGEGKLALVSPYDPMAGFNVGNAMQRNKLIYALADCALVVNSDFQKGGTWAGAVEQLEKFRFVPVYVRRTSESNTGLDGLRRKGALTWPEPTQADTLAEILTSKAPQTPNYEALTLPLQDGSTSTDTTVQVPLPDSPLLSSESTESTLNPAEALFAKVKELLVDMDAPKTNAEVADELQVSSGQAKIWLQRLVEEGVLEQLSKPTRYRSKTAFGPLFDRKGGTPSNSGYDRAAN